ncbi:MAG: EAL domain-containing protein [Acidobacteriota bacterium]|nr:EAL domain-containing protein [Acidobacteriota bacterium]
MKSGEETRLVVETLMEVIPGTQIVAIVTTSGEPFEGLEMEPLISGNRAAAFERMEELVRAELSRSTVPEDLFVVIDGVEWGVLVNAIEAREGVVVGALIVAREGRVWSPRERSLGRGFGGLLSHVAAQFLRESKLIHQTRLDELVSNVAVRLMSASSANRQEVLDWTVKELCEFLSTDVAFIRRNDHVRGLSIMEAEWPVRTDVPNPDPLAEVPFDSDPIFGAMRDLRGPYLPGVDFDEYLAHVDEATGVEDVFGAAVPLLMHDQTWGILGFLHFDKHTWVQAEINALQAVASLLVQLQARIDAEEQTVFNANHDELTGLPNRRALIHELVRRIEEGRDTAVMIIDLDRFKVMNDFLGHASGDRLLVTIADRLRTSIRANDFAARLGGDEFVFLVDQITSEMEILATSFRLLEVIAQPVDIHGQMFSHTASIGIALAPDSNADAVEMLGWADVALYSAKNRGRNQAVVFDAQLREVATERSELELSLRDAIDEGGLRLHFQPEVDLRTGRLLALEALVRWEHPVRGMIPAAEFITVAEETGLIVHIGRWVFAEACRTMATWRETYPSSDFVLRINMSPAEFLMEDIVEFVEECLVLNGIPGERVCIEITEYTVLDKPDKTAKILLGFQALGVEVALDDFGTGFASMTELKNLPVNVLKLDLSFVQGITHDIYDRAIVESIIRLGNALSLKVVAEGIETTDIADKLVDLGCQRGQGYLISRPVPPRELETILRNGAIPIESLRSKKSLTDHVVHG